MKLASYLQRYQSADMEKSRVLYIRPINLSSSNQGYTVYAVYSMQNTMMVGGSEWVADCRGKNAKPRCRGKMKKGEREKEKIA